MNPLQQAVHRCLVWYLDSCPAHRGKWRVVQAVVRGSGLDRAGQSLVTARRGGCDFRLDLSSHIDRKIFYQGGHEGWDTRFVESLVPPGGVVVDVGANIGWYSMVAARRCGAEGRVFSFEISAPEAERLRGNVRLNGFSQVEVVFMALSDRTGEIGVTANRDAGMTAIATSDAEQATRIAVTTLDAFCAENGVSRLDFIKCDIEGSEVAFLRGAAETLRRFRPVLLIEINPSALAGFGTSADELFGILRGHGYSLFTTDRTGIVPLGPLTGDFGYINAAALPEGMAPAGRLDWAGVRELAARRG